MSRPYHQFCGVAKALEVVGERWTLLIVRDLLLGPRRFGELASALAGVPPALLTSRLRGLVAHGLAESVGEGRERRYALTARGNELEAVVLALGRFGAAYLRQPAPDDRMNVRWAMVSLKRRYLGCDRAWRLQIESAGQPFALILGESTLAVQDGEAVDPDVRVAGDLPQIGALLTGRMNVTQAMAAGLAVDGEVEALVALLGSLSPAGATR